MSIGLILLLLKEPHVIFINFKKEIINITILFIFSLYSPKNGPKWPELDLID